MIKISNKTKLALNMLIKIIVTMLIGCSFMLSIVLIGYKPVYLVTIDGEEVGYIKSKLSMNNQLNTYMQTGDGIDNFGYVVLNKEPEYQLELAKKVLETNEEEVYAKIKDQSTLFYKLYAVEVNESEVCKTLTLASAQEIVDGVNSKQKNYSRKADITISEVYEEEIKVTEDVTVAVNDIIKPIKTENDKIVKKYTSLAANKTVSSSVLATLRAQSNDLNFIKPVNGAVITSRYGWRRNGTDYHTGLDYAIDTGTPIHAIEDGIVTCAKWTGNYGYLVKVQHTGGYETYYAHCSRFAVSVGMEVKKGDTIAYVGSTGNSTGPHVHLEIRYDGKSLNPENFL